jgi:hypothetical protein
MNGTRLDFIADTSAVIRLLRQDSLVERKLSNSGWFFWPLASLLAFYPVQITFPQFALLHFFSS